MPGYLDHENFFRSSLNSFIITVGLTITFSHCIVTTIVVTIQWEKVMTATELLQQIGLNKYEAEAYYTLLADGPLTGYELGKRSQVPLSRSYEILERLTQKGLALVQPGDPPRYSAGEPQQFLGKVRSSMSATLDALSAALVGLSPSDIRAEFWVLRGQQHILARTQAL